MYSFFRFAPHSPLCSSSDFLLGRLGKRCHFVSKFADIIEVYPDMLNGVFCPFSVSLMYFDSADKLVENGGGKFGKVGIAFCQLHKPLRPPACALKGG